MDSALSELMSASSAVLTSQSIRTLKRSRALPTSTRRRSMPKGSSGSSGDFSILKPADPGRGNRRIFFDYGNRGNKRMLQFFNDAPASNDPRTLAHAGNGFLMRRGYTVVWLAWQGDLLPGNGRMVLDLPVAAATGPVRVEYIADRPGITTFPLSGHASTRSHPAVSLDPREARLTRRRYPDDERIQVQPESWRFARVEGGVGLDNQGAEQALIPSDMHIHIPGGFETGWIYELVYTGRNPLVLGLGHAAVRDFVSFLRYGDRAGLGEIEKAYAWGRSQTGRCIRDFVYRGFNADVAGRKVFDGVLPHVAGAGRKWLNHRFANAVVSGGQQYEDHFNPADTFPFSYAESTDHLTGRRDAILKRPETDPLVIHTRPLPSTGSGAGRSFIPIRAATTYRSRRPCGFISGPARSILPTRSRNRWNSASARIS